MLSRMYLTGFLSFKERTEFDFTTSKYSILEKSNVYNSEILKGALIIGPNASGKTNALNGISFLLGMIKGEGTSFSSYKCHYDKSPITAVEYEFIFDEKTVYYTIEYNVNSNSIKENLTIDGVSVLKREGTQGELVIGDVVTKDDQIDGETLFLRAASFNTGRFPSEPTMRRLMDFLHNSYFIDGTKRDAARGSSITKYAEENGVDKINSFLESFNYDFFVEFGSESEGEDLKISVDSDKKVVFLKRRSFPIPNIIFNESWGNQVFANLLPFLIKVTEKPGMLIIDEFGNSLHNKLAEKIIKYFMNNAYASQLFITSQHTNLISHSIFRPDQVNLVTFQGRTGSKVERLSKFKPREAQNLEKMYLGGMFEGLPIYDKIQD